MLGHEPVPRGRPATEPGEVVTGMFHLEPVLPHDNPMGGA
ncbi:unnamed protein product [[Actinomadura] parvosata subsp. kistnae]|nr:unnamed protein product [Actinomadura parvosata subsp. kistnae]